MLHTSYWAKEEIISVCISDNINQGKIFAVKDAEIN
jgi:hypothetical protein